MARMTERAQSLLVGAVFMAVIFVSLALLLNSSLYGTTIASDASADVTGGDGAVLRDSVRDDVGYLMNRSHVEHYDDYDAQRTAIERNVTAVGEQYSDYYAQYDRIVEMEGTTSEGSYLTNAGPANFEFDNDADPAIDTTLVSGVRYRQFTIEPTGFGSDPDSFELVLDGSETWTVTIDDHSTEDIEVAVSGPESGVCTASSSSGIPTVDITNASVGGQHCPPLDFAERTDPPYTIEFHNADQIEGDYGLFVSDSGVTIDSGADAVEAVYSTTVDIWERTPENRYKAQIRVAPGEPR